MDIEKFRQSDIEHNRIVNEARNFVLTRVGNVAPVVSRWSGRTGVYLESLEWTKGHYDRVRGTDDPKFPVELWNSDDLYSPSLVPAKWLDENLSDERITRMVQEEIFVFLKSHGSETVEYLENKVKSYTAHLVKDDDASARDFYELVISETEEQLATLRTVCELLDLGEDINHFFLNFDKAERKRRNDENLKREAKNAERRRLRGENTQKAR